MNILFVDHTLHRNTHSADFLLNILTSCFTVETHYYDQYYDCRIPTEKAERADLVIFYEFLADRYALGMPGKPCVFVPMFDNEWGSKWQWQRIAKSGMSVISFCQKITTHARKCGVTHLLDVRFAFNPAQYTDMEGDPRKVALWERGQINFDHVKKLFSPDDVDKTTLFRRPEPNTSHAPLSETDSRNYKVTIHQGGYIPAEEYLQLQKESGVYISPRLKEGIGMTFLEQMAMGKCVIAHNEATMNEYIVDGVNGILRDFTNGPTPVSSEEITKVRKSVRQSAERLYARWCMDKDKIPNFLSEAAKRPPLSIGSTADRLRYLAFLSEGLLYRVAETIR